MHKLLTTIHLGQALQSMILISKMKEHLQISWLILLKFQIILDCSMNNPGALVANTDTCTSIFEIHSLWPSCCSVSLEPKFISQYLAWCHLHQLRNSWLEPKFIKLYSFCLVRFPWFGVLQLSGIISPQLSNLTFLQLLNLSKNSFYGQFSWSLASPHLFSILALHKIPLMVQFQSVSLLINLL